MEHLSPFANLEETSQSAVNADTCPLQHVLMLPLSSLVAAAWSLSFSNPVTSLSLMTLVSLDTIRP